MIASCLPRSELPEQRRALQSSEQHDVPWRVHVRLLKAWAVEGKLSWPTEGGSVRFAPCTGVWWTYFRPLRLVLANRLEAVLEMHKRICGDDTPEGHAKSWVHLALLLSPNSPKPWIAGARKKASTKQTFLRLFGG